MANQNLTAYINNPTISNRFVELLGKDAPAFKAALLNVCNNNDLLQNCDPRSVVGAAGLAASVHLSLTPSLGQAYIVPYRGKALFQIGKRGLIQLAHRTGKYVALHAGKVYEGQISGFNPVTGEPIVGEKISDEVVGYVAYMRLNNGFEKTLYMSKAEIEEHAEKYSQSYAYDKRSRKQSSPWSTNFDAMAEKTVLKRLLNNWGILSAEMATVIQGDQSVVDRNTFTYVDNKGDVQARDGLYVHDTSTLDGSEPSIDMATGEVVQEAVTLEAEA